MKATTRPARAALPFGRQASPFLSTLVGVAETCELLLDDFEGVADGDLLDFVVTDVSFSWKIPGKALCCA